MSIENRRGIHFPPIPKPSTCARLRGLSDGYGRCRDYRPHRAPPSRRNRIWRGICSLALRNHRAQSPSRSLPLFSRAGRSSLRVALSTNASLLPLGAFALVPLLHDDKPRTCVPMTTTPNGILKQQQPVCGIPFILRATALARLSLTRNTGDALEVAPGRSASPHGIRRSSAISLPLRENVGNRVLFLCLIRESRAGPASLRRASNAARHRELGNMNVPPLAHLAASRAFLQ